LLAIGALLYVDDDKSAGLEPAGQGGGACGLFIPPNASPGVVHGLIGERGHNQPLLPAHDVAGFTLPARLPISTQRYEVIAGGVVVSGALVGVRPAPRIDRDFLAEVGALPARGSGILRRRLPQGAESLSRRRIAPVVEAVPIERGAEHLDLGARGDVLRLADVGEDVGRHQARQHRDDDDDDEDFDEREASAFHRPSRWLPRRVAWRPRPGNPKCYGTRGSVVLRTKMTATRSASGSPTVSIRLSAGRASPFGSG